MITLANRASTSFAILRVDFHPAAFWIMLYATEYLGMHPIKCSETNALSTSDDSTFRETQKHLHSNLTKQDV